MNYINILISIDDAYVIHAKDLITTLNENNINTKFNIYLIHDNKLSKKSLNELETFINKNNYGKLKPYYFDTSNKSFPIHIEYITQNTYYRLFAPYIIEDDIDKLLYLDCDILCNGDISEFYNQSFDGNILVACENIVPSRLKEKFKKRISYLNLEEDEIYINAGVLLIDINEYKKFISIDELNYFINKHKDEYLFQDQDIINSLFRNKIKIGNIKYNYQINVIDYGLRMNNCSLIHYSEANKPWNNVRPLFKRYLHYYKYLYDHNRKDELSKLLLNQYDKYIYNYYLDYIEKLGNKFNEIDIIIPVYNSKDYLSKALDSISKQSYKDIRVYIIDDASDDNYSDIIKKYNNLNIFYKKLLNNVGPGKARQIGIDNSFGNYIIFLDSDDTFYDKDSVELLYNAIENYDVVTSHILEETENRIFENENIGLHGKIYRRELLEKYSIKFPNTRLNEDTYFNTMCVLNGARYNNINELTYLWCDNPNSITRSNKEEHVSKDIISYCSTLLNAITDYIDIKRNINNERLLECLVESIIIVADKYRICSDYIKDDVLEILQNLIRRYKQFEIIDNFSKYIIKKEINNIYSKNKETIYSNVKSKIIISNFNNENKIEKLDRKNQVDEYNKLSVYQQEKKFDLINKMFKKVIGYCIIESPLVTNWGGKNVTIKNGAYINSNCNMIDDGNIEIGFNTLIGTGVTLCTSNHPIDPQERLNGTLYVSDILIGNNVWIGAGAIILPGVTIGNNSVIGAGSVVTKDIPPNVVAYGNPCRVQKYISNEE